MKRNGVYFIFIIAGAVPVYMNVCWLIVFNAHPKLSQVEKQKIFRQNFLLDLDVIENVFFKLSVLVLGLCSVVYFGYKIGQKKDIQDDFKKNDFLNVSLFVLFTISTLLNIWGML
ncbi:MAG: hypothetical protein KJ941_00250 [Bacteroidetes bacterium]|nr:hypothetical protein [Bacteroidota bacterium]